MDVFLVVGAKLVVGDHNTVPNMGVRVRIHRFGEHVKSLQLVELVGFPNGQISKSELGWVRIYVYRVPNISWFDWR